MHALHEGERKCFISESTEFISIEFDIRNVR
jgi:hypothetical protein